MKNLIRISNYLIALPFDKIREGEENEQNIIYNYSKQKVVTRRKCITKLIKIRFKKEKKNETNNHKQWNRKEREVKKRMQIIQFNGH